MKNGTLYTLFAIALLLGAVAYFAPWGERSDKELAEARPAKAKALLYKDPNCGCCVGYARALEKYGISVEQISTRNISEIKSKYGIAPDKQSCHTVVIDKYVVEGHVPIEAIDKLLTERPDIDGIGLPGMPAGTPGMPGKKRAPYEVYQIKNGTYSPFMSI